MEKRILLPQLQIKQLQHKFCVSSTTVYRALKYKRDTAQARAIRAAALELGGRIFDGTRAPEASRLVVLKQGERISE